jgi:Tol biopolymer transport system component
MKRLGNRLLLGVIIAVAASSALAVYSPATAQKFSEWSAPINLGPTINSPSAEYGPAISKNGLSLYISSTRPGGEGSADIWVSQRTSLDAPWGVPVNLGPDINTENREHTPNFSRDGHWMFFTSDRDGYNVWASWRTHTHDDFGWRPPVKLGAGVNSEASDVSPHYFENEDVGIPELFFASTREGGLGRTDIYVSLLASDGSFDPAVLVPELSSPNRDARPNLRHDGREIFFYSDRPGGTGVQDLWVSTRETTFDTWSTPMNLGPTVNSDVREFHPALSSDGQTLFFGSDRAGGSGGLDLYMITRTKRRGRR